ncbi:uroporphyrinogen decarboxylase [Williamsia sterculiae]|uniref:Uroporphyrinogen decarboxylase n=1 Tax=Williamsia sterculiae TaxID=1344003 RepID=A0A1N7EFJ4_9NOCA|nr:uroporphyrinogen decarboxylase [Williamsia sterculiae]SIR86861.1 uroporphyrinogen decarboxylase [Williamsia sterculiae]
MSLPTTPSATAAAATRLPLIAAATGATPDRRPVWFMRQAGRSLPEYREVRAGHGMLEACFDADLLTEITLQPVRRHGVDAAILFSDIVVPLRAAGIDLDIVAGTGPVIAEPVRDRAGIATIPQLLPESVGSVARGIGTLTAVLRSDHPGTALIGFAGAPFTLASYLIEGGPSRNYERTKSLMYSDPEAWHQLVGRLADITIAFLRMQLEAGVDAVQLFDSWAGMLSLADYREYVQPHSARVLAEVADFGRPRIHFGVGTGELLAAMGEAGADVVGVDWRLPLDTAQRRIGGDRALQGNLDPAILSAPWAVIDREVRRICAEADAAIATGARGHIFNLGHGVLPETDPTVLTRIVELVHTL